MLHGHHPRATADLQPTTEPTPGDVDALASATALHEIHEYLRTEMSRAQSIQAEGADRRRSPAPIFRPGDRVWLDARNIKTRCPTKKLDHRRLRPYKVIESVGPSAVRLLLPDTVRLHPVFHVSLLEHAATDPFPGQVQPPPPAVIVDGEEEYEVERILDSRFHYRRFQYLVKWIGYDHATWQPAADLEHAAELVQEYHRGWPDRPRPPSLVGARTIGGGYCHGPEDEAEATPSEPPTEVAAATVGSPSPVTQMHHDTYGAGARMFEDMWAGRGCRRGRDRRGLGAG